VPTIGLANVPPARGPVGEIGMLDPASGVAKAAPPGPKVGQPAPDFGWQTAHGHSSLRALRGLEVLLVFFAPWCVPCQNEQPWMASLLQAYGDAGLKIVGVSASPYGIHFMDRRSKAPITKGDLASYRDTYQVSYPLVFDPGLRVANLYGGLAGVPVYYVIDRSGIVRFETTAGVTEHDLGAQVQAAL
jgi:peroxiredoxin